MTKHFEFTGETSGNLKRIRALIDLPWHGVRAGDLGGWIEKEENLCDLAWVSGDAQVFGKAQVFEDAQVFGKARVFENADLFGKARVFEDAQVFGRARAFGDARVFGKARVFGNAELFGKARAFGDARLHGDAQVSGDVQISKPNQVINVTNLQHNITITPQNIVIGCECKTHEEWFQMTEEEAKKLGCEDYWTYVALFQVLVPKVME